MVIRYRVRINHPTQLLNLHVSSVSPLPKSYRDAFNDPNWQNALFLHKYLADGTLSRYKARLVANGSTQLKGVDVDETFSLVVKTDIGSLNYFLGISITRDSTWIFLSQHKYAVEILKRAHMASCNPIRTPVDT
ncbi:ribonuclease H-like domain-containing protein, partial [Tanacetum coccineum]